MTQLLAPDIATDSPAQADAGPSRAAPPALPAPPPLPSPGRIPPSARPSEARAAAAARLFRAYQTAEDPGPTVISEASRPSETRAAAAARLVGGTGPAAAGTGRITEAARSVRTALLVRWGRPAPEPNGGSEVTPGPSTGGPGAAEGDAGSATSSGSDRSSGSGTGGLTQGAPGRGAAVAVGARAAAVAVAVALPEQEEERHLRVVEAPVRTLAQRRRRARILLASVAGLAAVVAFGLVYLHVVLAQRQFTLDRLNAQVQTAQANYQQLRLKVAELGSPQHIITNAEGRLGMHQPTAVTYVTPSTQVAGSGPSTSRAPSPSGSASGVVPAPAGGADWPSIKSLLAGSP